MEVKISVHACGVAVGLYFLLRPQFGTETLSWMCILGASPISTNFVKNVETKLNIC